MCWLRIDSTWHDYVDPTCCGREAVITGQVSLVSTQPNKLTRVPRATRHVFPLHRFLCCILPWVGPSQELGPSHLFDPWHWPWLGWNRQLGRQEALAGPIMAFGARLPTKLLPAGPRAPGGWQGAEGQRVQAQPGPSLA